MFACEPSAADPTFRRVFVTDRLRCALPLPRTNGVPRGVGRHRRGHPAREGPRRCRLRAPRSGDGRRLRALWHRLRRARARGGGAPPRLRHRAPAAAAVARAGPSRRVRVGGHERPRGRRGGRGRGSGSRRSRREPRVRAFVQAGVHGTRLPFLRAVLDRAHAPSRARRHHRRERASDQGSRGRGSVPHGGLRASSRRSASRIPGSPSEVRG